MRRILVIIVTALTLYAPSVAAQSPATPGTRVSDATPKQKLDATRAYQLGVEALEQNDPVAALVKLRESYGIVASPNTHMMIVRTLAQSGRLVEAHAEALLALEEAERVAAADPDYQPAVEGIRNELADIERQIALVTVDVAAAGEDAILTVAGREVEPSKWGRPLAVMPGPVEVKLTTATGTQTQELVAGAGQRAQVSIAPASEKTEPAPPPAPTEEGGYQGPDRRMLAYVAGGVGVLGFVGFGVFGVLADAQFDRLDSGCRPDPEFCDPDLEDEKTKGERYQAVANAGLAIGLIGVAAGAGLFLWDWFDPAADEVGSSARRLHVGVGPGSLSLSGSF